MPETTSARAQPGMHPTDQPTDRHPDTPLVPVIAFANHKGGCGKTTTTANLAAAFVERGRRVLAIDTDPQGNLGDAFGISAEHPGPRLQDALADPAAFPVWDTATGVDLVPCSPALADAVTVHAAQRPFALADLLHSWAASYDVVLIDTPPGVGPLSSLALLAANWVIVCARPAELDLRGALRIKHTIDTTLAPVNPRLRTLGVLLTQTDRRWRLHAHTTAALADAGVTKLAHEIPFAISEAAAPRAAQPTLLARPDGRVAAAYRALAGDLATVLL